MSESCLLGIYWWNLRFALAAEVLEVRRPKRLVPATSKAKLRRKGSTNAQSCWCCYAAWTGGMLLSGRRRYIPVQRSLFPGTADEGRRKMLRCHFHVFSRYYGRPFVRR